MKQKIKAYLVVGIASWNKDRLAISSFDPDNASLAHRSDMKLREIEVEVDVPKYDINTLMVEALEAVKAQENVDHTVRQNLLQDQINNLKCISQEK